MQKRMRAAPAVTAERIWKFMECVKAEMTPEDTARTMGMSLAAMYRWRKSIFRRGIQLPPVTDTTRGAERIRWMRQQCGLSVTDLARELGVTKGAVHNWESGTCRPSLSNMRRLMELTPHRQKRRSQAQAQPVPMATVDIVSF